MIGGAGTSVPPLDVLLPPLELLDEELPLDEPVDVPPEEELDEDEELEEPVLP